MLKITLDDRALQRTLNQIAANAHNTLPLMRAIAGELSSQTDKNLQSGQGADGRAFAALADSTKAQRAKAGKWPGQILQVKGLLAKSIISQVSMHSAQTGSNLQYARIQQLGGKAGRGRRVNLPARPYLPVFDGKLQAGLEPVLLHLALAHLARGI